MEALFALYGRLLALGVPREDARFVLPYCFRSNFYMTLNAREFIHMVRAMLYGRGARWAELRALGASLKEQFERLYPGMIGEGEAAPSESAGPRFPDRQGRLWQRPSALQTRLWSFVGHGGEVHRAGEQTRVLID